MTVRGPTALAGGRGPDRERAAPGAARASLSDQTFGVALLTPALAIITALLALPLMLLVFISVKSVKLGSLTQILGARFTLGNYAKVLADPDTWSSLAVSGAYIVGASALAFALGLYTALLLNEKFPAQRLFRTLVLLPWAVPGITATIAFLWIMQPSFGVLNYLIRSVGLSTVEFNWFGDSRLALFAVIMPTVWKTYPFFTLMLLAALQTIPAEMNEAASIDGADGWRRFRWITWPSIRRYAAVALVFNAMHLFREFDFIYASTGGGPRGATDTIAIRIYNLAFEAFDMAAASALGVMTFVAVAIAVYGFVRWQMNPGAAR